MTIQELQNEYDMLKGNINRMFVTKDDEEFESGIKYAKKRLDTIYKGLKEIRECQNI